MEKNLQESLLTHRDGWMFSEPSFYLLGPRFIDNDLEKTSECHHWSNAPSIVLLLSPGVQPCSLVLLLSPSRITPRPSLSSPWV